MWCEAGRQNVRGVRGKTKGKLKEKERPRDSGERERWRDGEMKNDMAISLEDSLPHSIPPRVSIHSPVALPHGLNVWASTLIESSSRQTPSPGAQPPS